MGETELTSLKKCIKKFLPKNVKPRFIYTGKKIGSFFQIKDAIKLEHQSNLVYEYAHGYVGETAVRKEHGSDKNSSIFKFARTSNIPVDDSDFKILSRGHKYVMDRKIAEALYIKKIRPKLNEQKYSHKLTLFN